MVDIGVGIANAVPLELGIDGGIAGLAGQHQAVYAAHDQILDLTALPPGVVV